MKVYTLVLGELGTNCYVIPLEDGRAIVIDPASAIEVKLFLESKELTLGAIILTHGHFDHFAGAAELAGQTGCEVIGAKGDEGMFSSRAKSWADFMPFTKFKPVELDRSFKDGDKLTVCGIEFDVIGTPGHTAGCCLLVCEDVIFSGDTLFNCSIGRTDGYSASAEDMRRSLDKIKAMDGDYTIYSGHGKSTTLSFEKQNNPYM